MTHVQKAPSHSTKQAQRRGGVCLYQPFLLTAPVPIPVVNPCPQPLSSSLALNPSPHLRVSWLAFSGMTNVRFHTGLTLLYTVLVR